MTISPPRRLSTGIPLLLVAGAILLMAGNIAHPIDADPTPVSRFDFATEATWIPIHLVLALGFLLLTAGVVAVGRHLQGNRPSAAAHVAGTAAFVGGTMLVTVFGALDGYATSALANSDAAPDAIRAAAIAEEAIDSGLAAMGTLAFFGIAVGALGVAMLWDRTMRPWIAWAAVAIGAGGTLAGVALLVQGPTTFTINLMLRPVAVAGTLWFIALGVALRNPGSVDPTQRSDPEHVGKATG